jgi:hypothetical protein
MKFYILDGDKTPRLVTSEEWAAEWASTEIADRRVREDTVGDVYVSTVFVGIDHRFFGPGDPLIFETMIFDGPHDGECARSSTWEEAEEMHAEAVARVKGDFQ